MHLTATGSAAFLCRYAELDDDALFNHLQDLSVTVQAQEVSAGSARGVFDALREDLRDAEDARYLGTLREAVQMAPEAAGEVEAADWAILSQQAAQMACELRGVI